MPRVVACGGRDSAFERFQTGHEDKSVWAVMLVDAERPVSAKTVWGHLGQRDGWARPKGVKDEQCHLMVQVMESWFLADVDALERYYGQGFRRQALPKSSDVEKVAKRDVERGLEEAAKRTGKGGYRKGRDSFAILGRLDPAKVRGASGYAERFLKALL